MIEGQATEADVRVLGSFTRPGWIPSRLAFDVAAALSQLADGPSNWASVVFTPRADSEPWTMEVTYKRGLGPQSIEIPGGGGAGSGAREILDLVYHPEWFDKAGDEAWSDWDPDAADVEGS
jgi:hypothetical protein